MKTRQLAGLGIAMVWEIAGALTGARAQGSLTPPGAPAPTMRTLAQVEPRTPITNAPCTITQSGSYYLITNLASTGHGIVIRASNVTLDLMGFSLTGDGGSGDCGVSVNGLSNAPLRDIVVRGGRVRGFGFGVTCFCAQNCRIEGLAISSNYNDGVYLGGCNGGRCDGNMVRDCAICDNGAAGVDLNGYFGACNGNMVRDCAISDNFDEGVHLDGHSGVCNGNTVADCAISGNGLAGVLLDGSSSGACNGNTVADCAVSRNLTSGVYLFGLSGACDGNAVARCVIYRNAYRGLHVYGADGNRIENNHVSGTTDTPCYGIQTESTSGNLVLQNSCVGQASNYVLSADDTCGPIVTNSGILAVTNGAAALSPWANFSR